MTGDNTVALAAMGVLATAVGAIIWLAKYFATTLGKDMQEHTKAAVEATLASKEQVKASKEVLTFMKALNGKLAKATIQTVQEQNIEHQTVHVVDAHITTGDSHDGHN